MMCTVTFGSFGSGVGDADGDGEGAGAVVATTLDAVVVGDGSIGRTSRQPNKSTATSA